MDDNDQTGRRLTTRGRSRMPKGSLFFDKIVPILLVGMGIITAALILFAAGVLLGIIRT